MQELNIETSQHVQIDYEPAGVGVRVLAYIVDAVILGIYFVFMLIVLLEAIDQAWAFYIFGLLPIMFYHLVFELLLNGQSLGKKFLNIRVIKTDGTPANLSSYLLRWVFRLFEITITSGLVAFFTIMINGKGQRLGDLAAGTTVINTKAETDLSDTLFEEIEEDYTTVYSGVVVLTDDDISIIKEVLREGKKYDRDTYRIILLKTRNKIAQKIGEDPRDEDPRAFLETIIKDYNVIHG